MLNHLKIICLLTLSLVLNFDISAAEVNLDGDQEDTYHKSSHFHFRFSESKANQIFDLLNTIDANTLANPNFLNALETLFTDAMNVDQICGGITALADVAYVNSEKLKNNAFISMLKTLFTEKVDTLTETEIMTVILADLCKTDGDKIAKIKRSELYHAEEEDDKIPEELAKVLGQLITANVTLNNT